MVAGRRGAVLHRVADRHRGSGMGVSGSRCSVPHDRRQCRCRRRGCVVAHRDRPSRRWSLAQPPVLRDRHPGGRAGDRGGGGRPDPSRPPDVAATPQHRPGRGRHGRCVRVDRHRHDDRRQRALALRPGVPAHRAAVARRHLLGDRRRAVGFLAVAAGAGGGRDRVVRHLSVALAGHRGARQRADGPERPRTRRAVGGGDRSVGCRVVVRGRAPRADPDSSATGAGSRLHRRRARPGRRSGRSGQPGEGDGPGRLVHRARTADVDVDGAAARNIAAGSR